MENFDIEFLHSGAGTFPVELFNALNSFLYTKNNSYSGLATGGAINYDVAGVPGLPTTVDGKVFFNLFGEGYSICYNTGATACLMVCDKYPYRASLEYLKTRSIKITMLRMTSADPLQLVQKITKFIKRPLTGKDDKIEYTVTIDPNNVNPTLNDFVQDMLITPETGLSFLLQASMRITVFYELVN